MCAYEDIRHFVLECHATQDMRTNMFSEIENLDKEFVDIVMNGGKCLKILLGANSGNQDLDKMINICCIICDYICSMYCSALTLKIEIGQ